METQDISITHLTLFDDKLIVREGITKKSDCGWKGESGDKRGTSKVKLEVLYNLSFQTPTIPQGSCTLNCVSSSSFFRSKLFIAAKDLSTSSVSIFPSPSVSCVASRFFVFPFKIILHCCKD